MHVNVYIYIYTTATVAAEWDLYGYQYNVDNPQALFDIDQCIMIDLAKLDNNTYKFEHHCMSQYGTLNAKCNHDNALTLMSAEAK